jgi:flagellar basal body rod protein FlgG
MSFQSSLSGINASAAKLDVIGVNVANAQTVGFKETRADFGDLYVNNILNSQLGTGTFSMRLSQQFRQGNLEGSANPLDIAVSGNGFFQVMRPDGALVYTRNGQFHVEGDAPEDTVGYLKTLDGNKVMGANGPIQIDMNRYAGTLRISPEGVIEASDGVTRGPDRVVPDPDNVGQTITVPGELTYQTLGVLQLHTFRNINGLENLGDNQWGETTNSGERFSGAPGTGALGIVHSGMKEASNSDLNENLVRMIIAQREYQGNSQALKIQNDMDLKLIRG